MDITVTSVSDYINRCFSYPELKKDDMQIFYRGIHTIYRATPHIPSIYYPADGFIEKEDIIFKEALSYFPDEFREQKTTVEKLIFMRHYGFPTRIMDISKNPLIALFFACFPNTCEESLQKDGIIYVYKVPEKENKYCDSDAVSIIANLCKRPISFSIKDIYHLDREEFNKEQEIQYLIHEIGEEKPYFHPVVECKDINSVVCLRPRMNNPRIIRQDGYFFLFGIHYEKKECAKINPDWIDDRSIIIPHDAKKRILKELNQLNINESFVYPDYEHISTYITEKYKKVW